MQEERDYFNSQYFFINRTVFLNACLIFYFRSIFFNAKFSGYEIKVLDSVREIYLNKLNN